MAQGYTIPLPLWLWDSTLQEPAEGWKIYYTVAGMGTPVATYSDAELTSQNTDPVVTANGTWRAFVAEAVIVDIEVTDASDVSIFTVESVMAMPDTTPVDPDVTAVPVGGVIMWTTQTAPTGFLLCNGAAVSRATYSDLNTLLAAATPTYPYGNGDGSTTFNVPDLRGKFSLGVSTSGTGSTLGGTGGTIDHTHTGPSHTHTVTSPRDGWGAGAETPPTTGRIRVGFAAGTGADASGYFSTADQALTSAAGGTGNTGTANSPFLALNFIIKT